MRGKKKKTEDLNLKPISFSSADFDSTYYAEVANNANLVDVRLIESNFSIKPEYYALSSEDGVKFSYNCKTHDPSFLEDEGVSAAVFKWVAEAKSGNRKILKIECSYFVMYEDLVGYKPEYALAYVYKVGKFTSYPYFRNMVSVYSANARAEMPLLPSLKERID